LGADGIRRVKEWVSQGGTLIGVGDAVSFLANAKVGLLAVAAERAVREKEAEKKEAEKKEPPSDRVAGKLFANQSDFEKAIRADEEMPDPVPGVLVKARTDPDHWITAGVAPTVNAMIEGRTIFTPIKVDKGVNAATFLPAEQLVAGGYLWDENRKQLALKPLVIVQPEGRGNVIGFTAEPSFRAYLDGMNLLFLNAIFRGPAHARTGGME